MAATESNVNAGRRVVNFVLGGGLMGILVSIFYPVFRFVIPPGRADAAAQSVVAAKANELGPNEGKLFRFGSRPGLLVRLSTGEYRAFSAVCAHLNCTVQYRDDLSQIWCACHNGMFSLTGEVLSGPPPEGLESFPVTEIDGEIVVSKA